jgi:hypothetical protein
LPGHRSVSTLPSLYSSSLLHSSPPSTRPFSSTPHAHPRLTQPRTPPPHCRLLSMHRQPPLSSPQPRLQRRSTSVGRPNRTPFWTGCEEVHQPLLREE